MENIGFIQTNRWNFSIIGLDNPFYKFQYIEQYSAHLFFVFTPVYAPYCPSFALKKPLLCRPKVRTGRSEQAPTLYEEKEKRKQRISLLPLFAYGSSVCDDLRYGGVVPRFAFVNTQNGYANVARGHGVV